MKKRTYFENRLENAEPDTGPWLYI